MKDLNIRRDLVVNGSILVNGHTLKARSPCEGIVFSRRRLEPLHSAVDVQNLRNTDENQRPGAKPERRDSEQTSSGVSGMKLTAKTLSLCPMSGSSRETFRTS